MGKTTVSVNLAAEFARRGATLLLDADPQASSAGWIVRAPASAPYPAEVRCAGSEADISALRRASFEYEYVVIDGPPSLESPRMAASLAVADLAVVPVTPSVIDLMSMIEATATSIQKALRTNPELLYAVLINRKIPGTLMAQEVRGALEGEGIAVCATEWSQSSAHVNAAAEGVPVGLYRGWNWRSAYREVESLADELLEALA